MGLGQGQVLIGQRVAKVFPVRTTILQQEIVIGTCIAIIIDPRGPEWKGPVVDHPEYAATTPTGGSEGVVLLEELEHLKCLPWDR